MLNRNCIHSILLLSILTQSVAADDPPSLGFWDVLPETILRPMGFVGLVGGCALFVASAPFTAAASIEAPHDAWSNSFNGFVGGPVRYTLTRPVGDYRFKVYPD
ncbi:MAG: hypothetical protein L0Y38_07115 [Methylococcaceae bacterium]|nr:hypothetical protein [Methylococcaceae bacterium]MCI0733575.1 hypothetical protein [Methylococcaceae bacterium]